MTRARVVLLLCTFALFGCLTLDTRTNANYDGPRVYSGVRSDAAGLGQAFLRLSPMMVFYLLDMPLSLVADTLLLPVTIGEDSRRQAELGEVLTVTSERPSVVSALPDEAPVVTARRLFNRCRQFVQELNPALADCYSLTARVVVVRASAPEQGETTSFTGAEYKRAIRAGLPVVRDGGDYITFRDETFEEQEAGAVLVEALRHSGFSSRTFPVSFLLGPDEAGEWRILEERGVGWPARR